MDITGGCQCGAIRYCLSAGPEVTICHCRMCQKAVGGPFAVLAQVKRTELRWTRGAPAYFKSSSMARRGFCPVCGTPLTYEGLESDSVEVTVGSLDMPARFPPRMAWGNEAKLSWVDGIAALPAQPTASKFTSLRSCQHPDHDT